METESGETIPYQRFLAIAKKICPCVFDREDTPCSSPAGGDSGSQDHPVSDARDSPSVSCQPDSQRPSASESGDLPSESHPVSHAPVSSDHQVSPQPAQSEGGGLSSESHLVFHASASSDHQVSPQPAQLEDSAGLTKHISQLWNRINESESTSGLDLYLPDRKSRDFYNFLSSGKHPPGSLKPTAGKEDVSQLTEITDAVSMVKSLLEVIGISIFATGAFLLIAYGLKRFQDVSANKEECRDMMERVDYLAKLVIQCEERRSIKDGLPQELDKAKHLIVKSALTYYSQIKSSPFSRFCKAQGMKEELVNIKKELDKTYQQIHLQLNIQIYDVVAYKERRLPREYPKHAVGIEKPVREVTDLLEWATEKNAVAVILYGFGGMGKTTVADAVFNLVEIEDCKYSHVELFKSIESSPNIIKLQKKILEDLMGKENIPEIRKYQDGQREIGLQLEKVSAFIYIDNCWDKDQLRQLLPPTLDKAKKVRLLITARDINVRKACLLRTPPKEYRMRGISSADATNLLKQSNTILSTMSNEMADQVNRIIGKCGGIPLMLNLVAQELSVAKDELEVREVFKEVENLEGEEFGRKLDSHFFVYDKLPEECKEAFLEICSFFRGWEWEIVADMVGNAALSTLERRALVAKGTDGVVTVPDLIFEVGRRKAKGIRGRFTATSELNNFLHDDEKVSQIRYLRYKPAKDLNELIKHNLKMPSNLKYMEIDGKLHCDDLENFPRSLLGLPDLRILKLFNFEALKELPSVLGDLVKCLRELSLSKCKSFMELPYSISKLKSLRVLRINHCPCVQELPHDIGDLESLVELDLSYCERLNQLRDIFGKLVSLSVLNLSFCKALERLPDDIGNLTSLDHLDLSHCTELKEIPTSIGRLKKLRSINMSFCSKLTALPEAFCDLSITNLKLTKCVGLKNLPDQFGKLQNLRVLKLKSCTALEKLPKSFSKLESLVHLDLSKCSELEELCENLDGLLSLQTLSLDGCTKLKKLPENLDRHFVLQNLNLSCCQELEGKWMDKVVESKALAMLHITESTKLVERWKEIQGNNSRNFHVDIGQDFPEHKKEDEGKHLSSEFDRLLQNGRGEPFHLSTLPPNTTFLLVMFDGRLDFKQDFTWTLIEETIDDIYKKFEIVYIGKHFNKLPKTVADKITGRALDNTDARLWLQKVFFTFKRNGENLWLKKMDKCFSISTKIVSGDKIVSEDSCGKYLSCWSLLSHYQLEEFVLSKCRRYRWLEQLASKEQENDKNDSQLLRELFVYDGEDYHLYRNSVKVGVEELKGKTILLEIRPADASFDVNRLQSLKDLYERERSNLEIISIPIGQLSIKFEQFSAAIPWLALQNSWKMTRVMKYFLTKDCQWEERYWKTSESWYPGRVRKIESNGRIAIYAPVQSMLQRWGPEVYPFTNEKIEELRKKEWVQLKEKQVSCLEFLLKPLTGELNKVMHQRKTICLLCDGKDRLTNRVRIKTFEGNIERAMKDVMDNIYFIYVPYFDLEKKSMLTVTDSIRMQYFPMEDSEMPELRLQPLLSLPQWAAMRFWMRVCDLRKDSEEMNDDKQVPEMKRLLSSLDQMYLSLVFFGEDGEVITTKGREIVNIFGKGSTIDDAAKDLGLNKVEAKELVKDMITSCKESNKLESWGLELESWLLRKNEKKHQT